MKLAPVVSELRARGLEAIVCATAQHRGMLDQVFATFGLAPDIDLDLMRPDQRLETIAAAVLTGVARVVDDVSPDVVLVQGDTATAMAAALSAFFRGVPVGHVEAGLRTGIRSSPFPEELMRRLVGQTAVLHFAPTRRAASNLQREHADAEGTIFLTGNTVVDAVQWVAARPLTGGAPYVRRADRLLLLTAHRRENFGEPLREICRAVLTLVARNPDIEVLYPVHPNPNVRSVVYELLAGNDRVQLVEPLDYAQLVHALGDAYLVLTDSGGLQEEAPVLGRPLLVLRRDTERPEAIEAGAAALVGTDADAIVEATERLLTDRALYDRMACAGSPFGDGKAAARIVDALEAWSTRDSERLRTLAWDGSSGLIPYRAALSGAR